MLRIGHLETGDKECNVMQFPADQYFPSQEHAIPTTGITFYASELNDEGRDIDRDQCLPIGVTNVRYDIVR